MVVTCSWQGLDQRCCRSQDLLQGKQDLIFFQRVSQCFRSSGADGVAPQAGARWAEKPRLAKHNLNLAPLLHGNGYQWGTRAW